MIILLSGAQCLYEITLLSKPVRLSGEPCTYTLRNGVNVMTHLGTQVIQTERLILRKITADDLDMIFSWMSDPELTKYEDWIPHESVDYTLGFISWLTGDYKTEQTYCWGIQLGDEIIGFSMVVDVNEWSGSIAYYIKKECWSKGYATEVVIAIMNYMFFKVGVD